MCVQARVNDQVVGYRDLAALPRDKAILQVERPDLMTYQPHLSFSPLDPPRREVSHIHRPRHLCAGALIANQPERRRDTVSSHIQSLFLPPCRDLCPRPPRLLPDLLR